MNIKEALEEENCLRGAKTPRSNLRPVLLTKYWPKEHTVKAYFHRWTESPEREVGAIVEYEDGTVDEWSPRGDKIYRCGR